ncbi:MAG: glycine-rich domain-containing protein-like [Holophagaceae bacterium]|nr:glycine-rich domain-containing protein-like [Holophagaceae bacterium]
MSTSAACSKYSPLALPVMSELEAIDLSMVKMKLMDEEEGHGWSSDFADIVRIRYLKYLCMLYVYPKESIVPTKDIDLFWHQHILDTRAYEKDCKRVFNYFVHHFPYFGMRDEKDALDLLDSFEKTKTIYANLFGEEYCVDHGASATSTCHKCSSTCHKCTSGCSGVQCHKCKS